MSLIQTVFWWEVDKKHSGLKTNEQHEIHVQREAIPLIFVPGIMGTRLRRSGTDGTGKGPDGLPNMRWDPNDTRFMVSTFLRAMPTQRKAMLVGEAFQSGYLEPANTNPVGDGFAAIMDDYRKFLQPLKHHDWGALSKVFEFPVFAFGYNWTDSAENAGKKLASRISEIIAEAKKVIGYCEKVILISHSMGGLVCRWASEVAGASASILGIVHAVQPVNGTPAGYWRMKAGFEVPFDSSFHFDPPPAPEMALPPPVAVALEANRLGFSALRQSIEKALKMGKDLGASKSIGPTGRDVTPLLGNMPGGLELLPNKLHRTNAGAREWLKVVDLDGKTILALPKSDPYSEIYRVKAQVMPDFGPTPGMNVDQLLDVLRQKFTSGTDNASFDALEEHDRLLEKLKSPEGIATKNAYWGLVDPELLNPKEEAMKSRIPKAGDELNRKIESEIAWTRYAAVLAIAERFHDIIGDKAHPNTFNLHGIGHDTADVVEMRVQSNFMETPNVGTGFPKEPPGGVKTDPYPARGFVGFFNSSQRGMRAVLQNPSGDGDGTVVRSSASALESSGKQIPGDYGVRVEHQPAYESSEVQAFAFQSIVSLCRKHYEVKRHSIGDFPAASSGGD